MTLIQQYLAIAVVAFLLGGGAAWNWQANSYGAKLATQDKLHADTLAELGRATQRMQQAEDKKYFDSVDKLRDQNRKLQEENRRVQEENESYVARLRTGGERVYVKVASCPEPGTASVPASAASGKLVYAPEYAELHPETAADLAQLATDANAEVGKLAACQAHIQTIEAEYGVQPK